MRRAAPAIPEPRRDCALDELQGVDIDGFPGLRLLDQAENLVPSAARPPFFSQDGKFL
jgi:hypothetical protein